QGGQGSRPPVRRDAIRGTEAVDDAGGRGGLAARATVSGNGRPFKRSLYGFRKVGARKRLVQEIRTCWNTGALLLIRVARHEKDPESRPRDGELLRHLRAPQARHQHVRDHESDIPRVSL